MVPENFTDPEEEDFQKKIDEGLFSQQYLSSRTLSRTQAQKFILDANSAYFNNSTSRELRQRVSSNDNLGSQKSLKKD